MAKQETTLHGLPFYKRSEVPAGLMSKPELRSAGLVPVGEVVAYTRVPTSYGANETRLYRVEETRMVKERTKAQKAGQEKRGG